MSTKARYAANRMAARGFTLIEIILVIGMITILAAMSVPNLLRTIEERRLPESARQMRSLLMMVRANAMYEGKRFRIRFPLEDELDALGSETQPVVEREDDPFREPGLYNLVDEPWAREATFFRNIRCAGVRLGRPTLERIEEEKFIDEESEDLIDQADSEFTEEFPPLYVETDGTTEWVTFVVTDAPPDVEVDALEDYRRIEVIMDGLTGLIWLQRPFYDEELTMFKENGWPPVLRKDFVRFSPLTEEDVLEIQESRVRK
jgi:prepilin-type N-terminal cleavage/methylation domain-containing protein